MRGLLKMDFKKPFRRAEITTIKFPGTRSVRLHRRFGSFALLQRSVHTLHSILALRKLRCFLVRRDEEPAVLRLEWRSGIQLGPLYPRASAPSGLGPTEPTTIGPGPNSTQKTSLMGEDCPHLNVALPHHQFPMWD
jgi:hypothetical protein